MDPFIVEFEVEYRGGAGTISDVGEMDSGSRELGELTRERTRSTGEMEGGCKALW